MDNCCTIIICLDTRDLAIAAAMQRPRKNTRHRRLPWKIISKSSMPILAENITIRACLARGSSTQPRYIMRHSFLICILFSFKVLAEIKCFGHSDHSKVEADDCGDIFEVMQKVDKVWAPMHFTRDAAQGYKVPHWWHKGSCTLLIDMLEEEDDDVFPLGLVIQAASNVVRACVMEPGMPGLGGRDLIGPKEKMLLVVAGSKASQKIMQNISPKSNGSNYWMLPIARNVSAF